MIRLLKKCIVLSVGLRIDCRFVAAATFSLQSPKGAAMGMIAPEILDNILKPNSTQTARPANYSRAEKRGRSAS